MTFSNGTEYRLWQQAWCETCEHDREFRNDQGPGCLINVSVLMGENPPEWGRGPLWSPQTVRYCTAYVAETGPDTSDCLCPSPNPDCEHPTCPRVVSEEKP